MPRPRLEEPRPRLVRIPGRRSWYIRWTEPDNRRSKVVSTGVPHEGASEPPDEARRALDDFIERLTEPESDVTVGQILDAHLKDRKNQVEDHQRLKEAAVALRAHLGPKRPSQLTERALKRLWTREKNGGGTITLGTARKEMTTLRAALNLALRRKWIDDFPAIPMPPKTEPRDALITEAQAQELVAAAKSYHVRLFLMLAMASGARKTSILELTWGRVDTDRGTIDFKVPGRRVTNKRRPVTAVGKKLGAALRDAREIAQTDHVIEWNGEPLADIKKGIASAAEAAGMPWVTAHVIKHSVVSWLAEKGYTVDQIGDLTETDPETIKRIYRKVNPDYLRSMADALDENLFAPTLLAQTRGKMRRSRKIPRNSKDVSRKKSTH